MKARLPQGYGGGPTNQKDMMKQVQKLQEQMRLTQEALDERLYTATAGGGAVSVTVKGGKEVTGVLLKPEVVDPEDIEMLQDLILAATNEALRTANETSEAELGAITGGLNIPGL